MDKKKLAHFVSEVFTINLCSMAVAYCVLGVLLFGFQSFRPYQLLILIYSSTILFSTIGIEWFFIIEEKFGYITARSIVFQLISLVLLFVLVRTDGDVPWYVMLTAISSAGSSVLNFFYSRKQIKISIARPSSFKRHLKPILIIWAANIASLIYINADTIIIGLFLGDAAIGCYSASVKIVKAVCIPIGAISIVAGPQLAEAVFENSKEIINKIAKQVLDFMSFFMFPCFVGLFLLGKESILMISGEEFLSGLSAERILLVDVFLSPLNGFIVNQLMIPIRAEKKSMIAMIVAAVVNIILDVILIDLVGITGAAIATVISETLVFAICLPSVFRTIQTRVIVVDVWKFAASSLVVIPVYYLCSNFFTNVWLNVGIVITLSIALYSVLVSILTHRNAINIVKNLRK